MSLRHIGLRHLVSALRDVWLPVAGVSALAVACSSQSPSSPTSNTIGPSGGTVSAVGAQITVPPGALRGQVAITLQQAGAITSSGFQAAGPAVACGPSGTTFDVPVTVTIPVTLPAGASISNVFVLKRDAGQVAVLTPTSTNAASGTVTVQTSSFSDFQAQLPTAVTYAGSVTADGTGSLGHGNIGQFICRCPTTYSATITMSVTAWPDGSITGTARPVITKPPGSVASCTNFVPTLNPQACDVNATGWTMFDYSTSPVPVSGTVSDMRWTVSNILCGTPQTIVYNKGATFSGRLEGDAIAGTVSIAGSCLPTWHNDISGSFQVTLRKVN